MALSLVSNPKAPEVRLNFLQANVSGSIFDYKTISLVGRKFFAGREQQEKEKIFLKCKLVGNPLGKESDSQSLRGTGLPVQAASAAGL